MMKAYAGTGSGMIIVGGLGGPDGKSTLTKRLTDELTGVSSAEISRHESWHRLRGMHVAKKRAEKQVLIFIHTGGRCATFSPDVRPHRRGWCHLRLNVVPYNDGDGAIVSHLAGLHLFPVLTLRRARSRILSGYMVGDSGARTQRRERP